MNLIRLLAVATFSLGLALTVQAAPPELKTFTYRVRVPAIEKTCTDAAQTLGARFAQATKHQVVRSECTGTVTSPQDASIQLYVLVVTYRAEKEVMPVSMVFGASTSDASEIPEAYRGPFASYTACLAELPTQIQAFESATKLLAVTATCEPGKAIASTFILRMEGFGKPASRLFTFNAFSEAASPEIMSQAHRLLTQSGAFIVKQTAGTFFYYAPDAIGLKHAMLGKFHDVAECEAQLPEAESIARQAGAKSVVKACIPSIFGPLMNIETLSDTKVWLSTDYGYNSPDYFSANECLQDKERVLNQARARGSRTVLGLLCLPEIGTAGSYKANLFTIL